MKCWGTKLKSINKSRKLFKKSNNQKNKDQIWMQKLNQIKY